MLERGGRRATVPFENLVMNAKNNIHILPGDRIYVYQEQQKFMAFGAIGGSAAAFRPGRVQFFDAWRINLAEAVAKAGGLGDVQADPGAVFLYRQEPREVAQLLGADMKQFNGPLVPVIFQIDFRDPGGYFLATRLQMRNDDIIFMANAHSYEAAKVLNFIGHSWGLSSDLSGRSGLHQSRTQLIQGRSFRCCCQCAQLLPITP